MRQRALGEYTFTGILFSGYLVFVSLGLEFKYGIKNQNGLWGAGSIAFASLMLLLFLGYSVFYLKRPKYFGEYSESFKKDKFSSNYYLLPILERVLVSILIVALLSV